MGRFRSWAGMLARAVALSSAFLMLSLLRAEYFGWPDFEHWSYGFPFLWLTHQTSSIAGPVDKWTVDLLSLGLNMVVWLVASTAIAYAWAGRPAKLGTGRR